MPMERAVPAMVRLAASSEPAVVSASFETNGFSVDDEDHDYLETWQKIPAGKHTFDIDVPANVSGSVGVRVDEPSVGAKVKIAVRANGELVGEDAMTLEKPLEAGYGFFAGLDVALWDLAGKATGRPVHQLLGGAVRSDVGYFGFLQGETVEALVQDAVEAVVVALRRMDRLGAAHLFSGLSREAQRAGQAMALHCGLGGKQAAEPGNAKARMRIGMAAGMFAQARARRLISGRRLAIAGHGVIFGIHADGGACTVRPMRGEGGRHAGRAFLDGEAMGAQRLHIPVEGLVFPPGRLAEIEDGGRPGREIRPNPVDMGKGVALG